MASGALSRLRICDLTGQLAGAGATRFFAALGAQVIRVEDPVRQGRWDVLRGSPPFVDGRRGLELGGSFNNHNVEKLGVTINLKTHQGRDLFAKLVAASDVVTENFAAGVLERLGFSYERLREIRPDIIYVSNCGFGHTGPYRDFKTWGPVVQAMCGLTFSSGLPACPAAGWGFSYMDHHGANVMAIAMLGALLQRHRTGEGQWVDVACTEAGATLLGPVILDHTVNGRPLRRSGMPDSNHSQSPLMVPHYIYQTIGSDEWIAIACRDDSEWEALSRVIDEPWAYDDSLRSLAGRLEQQDDLDAKLAVWTSSRNRFQLAEMLQAVGVAAAAIQRPSERIEEDENTRAWGLWPTVKHPEIGEVRVEGLPLHFSETDWNIARGAPLLGEHNDYVFGEILGIGDDELADLRKVGAI
jgi:crotonobetainyl-CoA:carnitine CoA-transferase CaiB-like acyl-CoA transferase